ncbi:MAG: primosomal protein N' [Deltaproteobacteria bacterium]
MATHPVFAQIALPVSIALDETFDYIVPQPFTEKVRPGLRVRVPFRSRTLTGYVMAVKRSSPFAKKCKPVLALLDTEPLLDGPLWDLARALREEYVCGFADILNTFLPLSVRSGKKGQAPAAAPLDAADIAPATQEEKGLLERIPAEAQVVVLADPGAAQRWRVYAALVGETLRRRKSVILTVPRQDGIAEALRRLEGLPGPLLLSSYLKRGAARAAWHAARNAPFCFAAGTRSAVFAPVRNLGLIIVDQDDDFAYHQEQAPCYRTGDVARRRCAGSGARCLLGSVVPSLDNIHLAETGQARLVTLPPPAARPRVTLVDLTRLPGPEGRHGGLSGPAIHRLSVALQEKETALIVTHQKCFVSALYCRRCARAVTCPRCSVPLKEHHKEKNVRCAVCGHTQPIPELCPVCHRSYVRRIGFGSEKTREELSRLFPAARVANAESNTPPSDFDIMLATPAQLAGAGLEALRCDLVLVLDADQPLAAADYRAAERTFAELWRLRLFARRELCVQTRWPGHYVFEHLDREDPAGFARREIEERRELAWPPWRPLASLTARSPSQKTALAEATRCYKTLSKGAADGEEVFEPAPARPFRVRGNYRYRVFIRSAHPDKVRRSVRRLMKRGHGRAYLIFDPQGGETT